MPKGKLEGYIKLQVPAGAANPSPPIGPALGQRGLNIMEFCKAFNAQTQAMEKGMPCPVVISYFSDRSFTFIVKKPPVSFYLMKAANIQKGASKVGTEKVGKIKRSQVKKIAEDKMVDLNAKDIDGAMRMIEGSARAMGVDVVEG